MVQSQQRPHAQQSDEASISDREGSTTTVLTRRAEWVMNFCRLLRHQG
jgi:hypothetical protein